MLVCTLSVFALHCLPSSVWFFCLVFKPVECDTSVVFVCVWGCSCIFHSLDHYWTILAWGKASALCERCVCAFRCVYQCLSCEYVYVCFPSKQFGLCKWSAFGAGSVMLSSSWLRMCVLISTALVLSFFCSKWWWACGCQSCRFFWATQAETNMDESMSSWLKPYTSLKLAAALPSRWRSRSSTDDASPPSWCPQQNLPCPESTTPLPPCPPASRSWDLIGMERPSRLCSPSPSSGPNTSWACPTSPRTCTPCTLMSNCNGCPSTMYWMSSLNPRVLVSFWDFEEW